MSLNPVRVACACVAATALLLTGEFAHAFYPIGGFNQFTNKPVYAQWPLKIIDANDDGEVSGPNDGVEVVLESGAFGFKAAELTVVQDSFDRWEVIPTSYAAFRFAAPSSSPLSFGAQDAINYVCMGVPDEPSGQFDELDDGTLGLTSLYYYVEETVLEAGGVQVIVSGGQIIDADIVINAPFHRVDGADEPPAFDLMSTMVHEIGHFIGLTHTPLNNFIESQSQGSEFNVEEKVLPLRDNLGQLVVRGVTPTMFPIAFFTRGFGPAAKAAGETGLSPTSPRMKEVASRWTPYQAAQQPPATPKVTGSPIAKSGEQAPFFYFQHTGETRYVDPENPPSWAKQRPRDEKSMSKARRIAFSVVYEDVENNTEIGFDHPTEGAARRAVIERVLDYLDTILNETGSCDVVILESVIDEESGLLAAAAPCILLEEDVVINPGYFNSTALDNITQNQDAFPEVADICVFFNFSWRWNTTEDRPVSNEFDLFSVALHEMTHGLGFLSLTSITGESLIADNVYSTFDGFLETGQGTDLFDEFGTPAFLGDPTDLLGAAGGLIFNGASAVEQFGNVTPPIYAPSTFAQGSSLSHWDQNVTCRAVMEPFLSPTELRREYSPIDVGALNDIGFLNASEPIGFEFECDGTIILIDGAKDLAPDDISAASFLYPRGDRDMFFDVNQEARTQTRVDLPSLPLLGGSVTAWLDHDNDDTTDRIPVFNTMTGLYENSDALNGRFRMNGLLKEFETEAEELFNATYILTMEPLNGLDAAGQGPELLDSMHADAQTDFYARDEASYFTVFSAEVFAVPENAFLDELDEVAAGTPVTFDPVRRQVVIVEGGVNGRSLSQVLPSQKPMFGDQNKTCPLNLIVATGLASPRVPDELRGFRDNYLFATSAGIALVDAYYSVAPALASLAAENGNFRLLLAAAVNGVEWMMDHQMATAIIGLSLMLALASVVVLRQNRKRRSNRGVAVTAMLLIGLMVSQAADARILYINTPGMVERADEIVSGKVVSVESRYTDDTKTKIVTDIEITIDEKVKGDLNKGNTVTLTIPGGQVGTLVNVVAEMPRFRKEEEVLLFLQKRVSGKLGVLSGSRGKYAVKTDEKTGEKIVAGETPEAQLGLVDAKAAMNPNEAPSESKPVDLKDDTGVPLDDYLDYLRNLVHQQKSADSSK